MRVTSDLPTITSEPGFEDWYFSNLQPEFITTQDTVHIGTKLRNRLFNTQKMITLGKFIVSVNHINILIKEVSKDKHSLCANDTDSTDRMNFGAVEKLCDNRVQECLKNSVPQSDGTSRYLKLINNILKSYIDINMSPIDRIFAIWHSVFFLRLWRDWLVKTKNHSLDNFITYNSYMCVEINAHSLIALIIFCKANNVSHLFLPFLFQSQTCEKFFRAARSMTTTYCTIVNFSMLDLIYKIHRIDFQANVVNELTDYEFARQRRNEPAKFFNLPSNEEIFQIIETAKAEAIQDALAMGMDCDLNEDLNIKLNVMKMKVQECEDEEIDSMDFIDKIVEIEEIDEDILNFDGDIDLQNFSFGK